jgi:D-3-phosphoglycerate dehydrogenase
MMKQNETLKSINVLIAEPLGYSAEAGAVLAKLGKVIEKEMSRSQLLQEIGEFDVLIVRLANQIDHEVINAGRRLRAIVTATTGLDHIDLEYARERGITVLSLRGETEFLKNISATAEHTWALLLGLLRNIVPASKAACQGQWNRDAFRGHELDGKRLGIVGLGRLGKKIASYGQAFDMAVAAFDPFIRDWLGGVRREANLRDLLNGSDILSLHIPLTDDTVGLIGAAELALLPPGAILVNTSRGQIVDEKALIGVLQNKHIAGAALDVVSGERDNENCVKSQLLDYARLHDNLLITPHIGGATHESMAKTEVFMAHKLTKFLRSLDED